MPDGLDGATDYVIAIPSYGRVETFRQKTYRKILVPYGLCARTTLYLSLIHI